MAEALYGIEKSLIEDARKRLPKEFVNLLDKGYSNLKKYF
jgi:hypothetical protein